MTASDVHGYPAIAKLKMTAMSDSGGKQHDSETLTATVTYVSAVRVVSGNSGPPRAFPLSVTVSSAFRTDIVDGKEPVNEFDDAFSSVSLVRVPMVLGMLPVSWLPDTSSATSADSALIDDGTVPVKPLLTNDSDLHSATHAKPPAHTTRVRSGPRPNKCGAHQKAP